MARANKKEEKEEYEVEKIVSHRLVGKNKKRMEYLIKWKNYSADDNTWEPENSVANAIALVEKYWKDHPGVYDQFVTKGIIKENTTKSVVDIPVPEVSNPKEKKKSTDKKEKDETRSTRHTEGKDKKHKETKPVEEKTRKKTSLMDNPPDKSTSKRAVTTESSTKKSKKQKVTEESEEKTTEEVKKPRQKGKVVEEQAEDNEQEESEYDSEEVEDDISFRSDWDWENDVNKIVHVQTAVPQNKNNQYRALLKWNDGKMALYPTSYMRKKCPQMLINYYESKLVFEKKNQ